MAPAAAPRIDPLPLCCVHCGTATNLERVVTIAANGAKQVWDRCDPCAKNARGAGILIPHAVAGRLEYYRVIEDYSESAPPCEVCGSRGTELHHWAPRYLFADAEAWPQSHLCLVCHRRWHEIVTPGMCEK